MNPGCTHGQERVCPPGEPYDAARHCRLCWLYDRPAPARRTRKTPLPCVHLGAPTGERADCEACGGKKQLPLHHCAVHGECSPEGVLVRKGVRTQDCLSCRYASQGYEPRDPFAGETPVRNLLYHVYPLAGEDWRWNVAEVARRVGLFNGRRVVAVVTDHRTESPADVADAFGRDEIDELISLQNDPLLREVNTFEPLFSRVQSLRPGHVTLYAHTKGVSRNHATRPWAAILHEAMLDHWPAVEKELRTRPVVGCFKKTGRGWPPYESRSEWHYSGSFFWFRNRDLFSRDWRKIDRFWSGIESYPSLHFGADEAACLFHEGRVPEMNLYDHDYLNRVVAPAFARWKEGRR